MSVKRDRLINYVQATILMACTLFILASVGWELGGEPLMVLFGGLGVLIILDSQRV